MRTALLWMLLAVCCASCGEDRTPVACAAYAVAGLGVSVENATTGQPLCDATVTATDGAYSERLQALGGCTYTGAWERPGTYVIEATRQGFPPNRVSGVRVIMGGGECPHVEQTRVTISLTPQG